MECLKSEMTVAINCAIQLSNKFGLKELKQVISKTVYPNLFKLLQVALVLPISSASCERSFSATRRIKSWTRTTMGQERLSDLSIIHIESDLVIDKDIMLNKFAENKRTLPLHF
ncbi:zinc finger MYM-type protein 1-like [Metopolophium dirhodum]|uniref:zinc finger MYM-type protein 1-like n=1 Tax=Metopolophium dirhodum TaxID=44670 RepID=UPI00298F853A|nr:zinc finger MYM-type protein 1-like [Metopolophium dirhodum]